MIDHLKALVSIFQADAPLAALVTTRVFGAELPRNEADHMPRQALVLKYAGSGTGLGSSYVEVTEFRIDALAYGETPQRAEAVRRAAHDVFHGLKRNKQGDALIYRADLSGGPISMRDRDTDWPLVLESWLVLAAKVSAA